MGSNIKRAILPNGITLIVIENPTADLVAGRIFLKNAGTLYENPEKAGLFHLLATVITKGTENLTSLEIADRVESTGAGLGADTGSDYFVASIKTVSRDFRKILLLLGEILRYPSFPATEVELEKNITRQNIRSQREQPFNVAFNQMRSSMYRNHPYGLSILGTEESVASLTREDLVNCHRSFFRPDNLVISLSGRITLEEAREIIEGTFGDWQIPDRSLPPLNLSPLQPDPRRSIEVQDSQQSIVMLGYLAPSVNETDYPVLKLLNTYLGNGLSSRLFVELREKRGLAYDVSAFYPTRLHTSQFIVYMGTAPVNTTIALEGLRAETERLTEVILDDGEIQCAKNKLLGQYALGKQSNGELAQLYGWYETLELGIEYDRIFQENIAAISPESVREVARKTFTTPYISLVGPADYIKDSSRSL